MMKKMLFLLPLLVGCNLDHGYNKKVEERDSAVVEYWIDNNNVLDGPSFIFFKNGSLKNLMTFKDGLIEGVSVGYYESGALKVITNLQKGRKEGFRVALYENGNQKEISYHSNDTAEFIKKYDEDGKIIEFTGHLPYQLMGETNLEVLNKEGDLVRNKEQTVLIYKKGCSYDELSISIDEGEISNTSQAGIYKVITRTKNDYVNIRVSLDLNGVIRQDVYRIKVNNR